MLDKIKRRFFNHKCQESLNSNCIVLTFVKLGGRWYADVPGWEGSVSSLEMVAGSDDFLDSLCKNNHFVTLEISLDNPAFTFQADLVDLTSFGGTYKLSYPYTRLDGTTSDKFWICNVTKYVFGEHPKKLYFKQIA